MTIRIGIIGKNYGSRVLLPAFQADRRCDVVCVADSRGSWRDVIRNSDVDALAIAVPPALQPDIIGYAMSCEKHVFAEKPMGVTLTDAIVMQRMAKLSHVANMIDYGFPHIGAFHRAKELLEAGVIGKLRHVTVTWQTETRALEAYMQGAQPSWKLLRTKGGGSLSNFTSHVLYYLEWFCGRIHELQCARVTLGGDPDIEVGSSLNLHFESGKRADVIVSNAAYRGSGHRIEFYGHNGSLTLINPTTDTMRGFQLNVHTRADGLAHPVQISDTFDARFPEDGRIATAAWAVQDFLTWITEGKAARPDFTDGLRIEALLDAARRSASSQGQRVSVLDAGLTDRAA